MAQEADSSSYGDDDLAVRRKLALAMMQQGMDTSPIRSPWQGVARIAQAMFGGYDLHQLADEDRTANQSMINTLPGLNSSPAPAAPQMAGTQSTPAADPNAPVGDRLTDFEKQQEGFAPKAAWDYKQNTFGYGSKADAPGQTISREDADKRLQVDLGKARGLVQAFAPNLSKKQEDALTDLTNNAGTKWMAESLGSAVKSGDWQTAKKLFEQYDHAGGSELAVLKARRAILAPNLLAVDPPTQNAGDVVLNPLPGQGQPGSPSGAAPITPQAVAAATAAVSPTASQVAGPGAPSAPVFDPETSRRITTLLASKRTSDRAMGMQLYQETYKRYMNPEVKEVTDGYGNKVSRARNPTSGLYDVDPVTGRSVTSGASAPAAGPSAAPAAQTPIGQAPIGQGAPASLPPIGTPPQTPQLSAAAAPPAGVNPVQWYNDQSKAKSEEATTLKQHGMAAADLVGQISEINNFLDQPLAVRDGMISKSSHMGQISDVVGPTAMPQADVDEAIGVGGIHFPGPNTVAKMWRNSVAGAGLPGNPDQLAQSARDVLNKKLANLTISVNRAAAASSTGSLGQERAAMLKLVGAATPNINVQDRGAIKSQLDDTAKRAFNDIQVSIDQGAVTPADLASKMPLTMIEAGIKAGALKESQWRPQLEALKQARAAIASAPPEKQQEMADLVSRQLRERGLSAANLTATTTPYQNRELGDEESTDAPATQPAAAAPVAPGPLPPKPPHLPAGSQYSPSRKMWRTPDGKLFSASGAPVG